MSFSLAEIQAWVVPIACIVVSIAVGAFAEFFVRRRVLGSRFVQSRVWLALLINALDAGLLFWFIALGLHIALQISTLPGNVERLLDQTLLVLVCISVTVVAMRFVGEFTSRVTRGTGQHIASGSLFASVAQAAVGAVGLLFTLNALGVQITPLLTALGVGGLAVALALQPPLTNLFSGLQLVASRQIRPGDYISLPGGQEGFVEDINWRSISIREAANNLVVVPNTVLAQDVFVNYRLPEPRVAARVPLRVAYGSDLAFVEKLALEAVDQLSDEVIDPTVKSDSAVRVIEFGDATVNLMVRFYVKRVIDQERAKSEFLRQYYTLLQTHKVGSPIANAVIDGQPVGSSR
jgi:small-conductance mechanosensitive channel